MHHKSYLVSVVIPTHNRSRYAIACICSLLEIESDELQVVVHDTSDDACELADWVSSIPNDHRLTYVHWPERLSMTENHERAIALAAGEYVCLIGDDDSVSAEIVSVCSFAKERGIELLTPRICAMYSWPDFKTRYYGSAHAGKLYLEPFSGKIDCRDVAVGLDLTLRHACQGTDRLPKLYHGLVKRSILNDLRQKYGRIFFGTSPDMSAAILIALQGGRFHVIDVPFTLPGASGGSNTGRSAVNKHKGDIEKDPHMRPFKNLEWPVVLPRFFSVETVWAHAAWETLRATGNVQWANRFNLSRLYALCFIKHRDYRQTTSVALRSARNAGLPGVSWLSVTREIVACLVGAVLAKARRALRPGPSNGREIVATVEDVRLARQALDRRIQKAAALQMVRGG